MADMEREKFGARRIKSLHEKGFVILDTEARKQGHARRKEKNT